MAKGNLNKTKKTKTITKTETAVYTVGKFSPYGIIKDQLTLKWLLNVFKTNENISVYLPYLSKIGQIKKRVQIIIQKDK